MSNSLEKGNEKFNAGKYREAFFYYNKALEEQHEDRLKILEKIGNTLFNLKEYAWSIKYYNQVLENTPANKLVLKNKWQALINLADNHCDNQKYSEAIDYYAQAIEIKPSADLWLKKGHARFNSEKYHKAYVCYKSALQMKPKNHLEILEHIGDALLNLEDYIKAIEYYNQALESTPTNKGVSEKKWQALIKLGDKFCYNEKYLEAIDYYTQAIEIKPNADLWLKKGHARFDLKDNKDALVCYENALKEEPKNRLEILEYIADLLYKLENYTKAIKYYNQILEIKSDNKHVLHNKKRAFIKLGDECYDKKKYSEAVEHYAQAIEIKPSAELWLKKGHAQLNTKDYKNALVCYENALKEEPKNRSEVLKYIGDTLFELEKYPQAIEYYEKLYAMQPQNKAILNNKKEALIKLGDQHCDNKKYLEATDYYAQAIEIKPSAELWFKKGDAYFYAQNYKYALDCLDVSLEINSVNNEAKEKKFNCLSKLGEISFETSDYEQAKNYYSKALKIKIDFKILIKLGDIALSSQQSDEAIKYYSRIPEKYPFPYKVNYKNALLLKANELYKVKNWSEAMVFFQKVINIPSTCPPALVGIDKSAANIAYDKGKYEQAEKRYLMAKNHKLTDEDLDKRYNLCQLQIKASNYIQANNSNEALECCKQILVFEPENKIIRSKVFELQGDLENNALDAYNHYKQAMELNNNSELEIKFKQIGLIVNGNNACKTGELSSAKKYYDELLKHEPIKFRFGENEIEVLRKLTRYCNANKEYEQALIYAEKVRSLRPNDVDSSYQKAKANILIGNKLILQEKYVEAVGKCNQALAAKPNNKFILKIKLRASHLLLSSIDKKNENNATILRIARDVIQIIDRFNTNTPPIDSKEFENDTDIANCKMIDNSEVNKIQSLAKNFISRKSESSQLSKEFEFSVNCVAANEQPSQKIKKKQEEPLKPNNEERIPRDMPSLNKIYHSENKTTAESTKSLKQKSISFQSKPSTHLSRLPKDPILPLQELSQPKCDLKKLSSFRYKKSKHTTEEIQQYVLEPSVEGIKSLFERVDKIESDQGLWAEAYVFLFLLNYYATKYGAEKVILCSGFTLKESLDSDQAIKTFNTAYSIKGQKKPGKEVKIMWFNYDKNHNGKGNRDIDVRKIKEGISSKDYYVEVKSHTNKVNSHECTRSELALMLKVIGQQNQKYKVYQVNNVNESEEKLSIHIKDPSFKDSSEIYDAAKSFRLKIN